MEAPQKKPGEPVMTQVRSEARKIMSILCDIGVDRLNAEHAGQRQAMYSFGLEGKHSRKELFDDAA